MVYDFAVIGGGIIGVSTALQLQARFPGRSLLLLEKEAALASHQSGRNSGVVHAGVYYAPGSLKAQYCREGARATREFCQTHRIPYQQCGKLLVATSALELTRMEALEQRCAANGIAVQRLGQSALQRREPHVRGLGALFVAASAIVDYRAVALTMARVVSEQGGDIRLQQHVAALHESALVSISTSAESFQARVVIACAGLMADRVAAMCGLARDFQILPFRGEYYRLPEHRNELVRHLIYPIPDPDLPFLGVHITRMIAGYATVGPNAVLGFAREGYPKLSVDAVDLGQMLGFAGFWRVLHRHFRTGIGEWRNSLSKSSYLRLCRKYCPELTVADLLPHPSGIRAQAVMQNGELLHDFLIRRSARTLHVCNAPSPGATSAIPIGQHIADAAAALVD